MAKLFTDRSDNDIKNKWYSMKRKDERNGTFECKNPFGAMNMLPNPTTVGVDYSSSHRRGSVSSNISTIDPQSIALDIVDDTQNSPSDHVDDTKVASTTTDAQCGFKNHVAEV
jgi:hypothetical protein